MGERRAFTAGAQGDRFANLSISCHTAVTIRVGTRLIRDTFDFRVGSAKLHQLIGLGKRQNFTTRVPC
jgi:hypothetical protein